MTLPPLNLHHTISASNTNICKNFPFSIQGNFVNQYIDFITHVVNIQTYFVPFLFLMYSFFFQYYSFFVFIYLMCIFVPFSFNYLILFFWTYI